MQIEVGNALTIGEPTPYFKAQTRGGDLDLKEAEHTLWETLCDAVRCHLDADVDVSLTLSGGINSTVLALIAAEQHKGPLTTYTVADSEDHPDLLQAKFVAKSLGAMHVPVVLNFDQYLAAIPGCIAAEEAYCSLMGLPYHMLSAVISRTSRYAFTGKAPMNCLVATASTSSTPESLRISQNGLRQRSDEALHCRTMLWPPLGRLPQPAISQLT